MILVDTSVWIRGLSNRSPFVPVLRNLLDNNLVAGHELVYGELLIGDRGGRKDFLAAYAKMLQAATIPHDEIVTFVREQRLHGRGVGWIDVHLLASAIVGQMKVWTADPRFAEVAKELGVAYHA